MSQQKPFSSYISQNYANSQNIQMTQSRYIRHSIRQSHLNPDVYHTFFHDNPIEKFHQDLRVYKPVMYQPPTDVDRRSFVVVDQKVKYGQPISKQQMERRLNRSREKINVQHQIITYGKGQLPPFKPIRDRQPVQVKIQGKKEAGCCAGCCSTYCGCCGTCCADDTRDKGKDSLGTKKTQQQAVKNKK